MAEKTSKYTAAPKVPPELQARYRAVLSVLSGELTVSEAARRLDMPRNHFQTLMHRGLEGLLEGLTPGRPGRPAKSTKQVELEEEVAKLRKQVKQFEARLDMSNKLMGLASSLLHGTARPRAKRRKADVTKTDSTSDEEPASLASVARQLDELGLPRAVAARGLGVPESTLRRHARPTVRERRDRARVPPADVLAAAVADVRALRGVVGAEALRRAHTPLSRRQAARVKRMTLTAMERERKRRAAHVTVTAPGVLRGFDAMDLGRGANPRYVLVAADGSVPFRTSLIAAARYDAESVARVLEDDFRRYGAPLVLRLDRAACHRAPLVRAVCARHGVLVLHGPARYPRFYGQLERQNREHAAWLEGDHVLAEAPLQVRLDAMSSALNDTLRRAALGWRTARAAWSDRVWSDDDRAHLNGHVAERAASLRASAATFTLPEHVIQRRAIEQALCELGYLRIETMESLLGDTQRVVSQS